MLESIVSCDSFAVPRNDTKWKENPKCMPTTALAMSTMWPD